MTRSNRLNLLKSHPHLKGLFKKLTKSELAIVEKFVADSESLDNNAYALKCNRWYLDQPKPKHYSDMWAIVSQL
jgi:hypothetical protein